MRADPKRSATSFAFGALLILFSLSGWSFDLPTPNSDSVASLKAHVSYLASPELTGRGVDTPGIQLARDYIARQFAGYGLTPGGDNGTFLQRFEVTTGVTIKEPATFAFGANKSLAVNEDWTPLGLSASGNVDADTVFAGYGISVKDYNYDDYAGIDTRGKIVIVLRYEPPPKDDRSPFRKAPQYSRYATLRAKVDNAREHGAVAIVLVDAEPSRSGPRELLSLRGSYARGDNRIVAVQVKQSAIESWFNDRGISLADSKRKIDQGEQPASRALGSDHLAIRVRLEPERHQTENVIGVLPGSDPKLKNEAIVIGAHYDHLGYGHFGTRDSSTEGQIHYGADDNASGTAVLMEVAQRLARPERKPARTIVFAAFSGEELGLLGSRHYVEYPTVRLSATKAMLNMDMVGRLRENRLTVFGTRSAQELSPIVLEEAQMRGLLVTESDGIGRSDHMSFYNKKIPTLHFFTGSHADYHRPSDTWDKLNLSGMDKIAGLVAAVTERVANARAGLDFVSLPSRMPASEPETARGYGAYLGTIPDMAEGGNGVKLVGVTDGSPAARAGLREGDIIVEFGGSKVYDLGDLATLLGAFKPGDEVAIVVQRGGTPVTLKATLQSRS